MGMLHNFKHGMSETKLYGIWEGMKQRCLNPNAEGYEHYGGRGITVCEKWLNFLGFYEDMSPSYVEGLTLDRINNNGNYELENCRWSTISEQNFNRRLSCKNKSGRTGVRYREKLGVFQAQITIMGNIIHLGTFYDFESACKAREEAELKYFGNIREN